MMLKHRTGAATLLTSMLATAATAMLAIRTVFGRVPALLSTKVAIRLSMLHLDSAAASVKPPSSSMMTGVHMAANTAAVACLASSLACGFSWSRNTRRTTQRNGMVSEVTKRGSVSVAQSKLTRASMARQFCCSGFSMMGTKRSAKKTATMETSMRVGVATSHGGSVKRPSGVETSLAGSTISSSPWRRVSWGSVSRPRMVWPRVAASARRSRPMSSRQTVFRSQTTCSLKCDLRSRTAVSVSPSVTMAL